MLKFKHALKPSPTPGQLLRVLCMQIIEGAISMSSIHGFHTFFTAVPTTCWQPGSTYVFFLIEVKKEPRLLFGGGFSSSFLTKRRPRPIQLNKYFAYVRVLCGQLMENGQGVRKLQSRLKGTSPLFHQYLSSPYNWTSWSDGDTTLHLLGTRSRTVTFSPQQAGRASMSDGTGQPKHSIICQANREGESQVGSRQRAQGDCVGRAQHYFAAATGTKRLHEVTLAPHLWSRAILAAYLTGNWLWQHIKTFS